MTPTSDVWIEQDRVATDFSCLTPFKAAPRIPHEALSYANPSRQI